MRGEAKLCYTFAPPTPKPCHTQPGMPNAAQRPQSPLARNNAAAVILACACALACALALAAHNNAFAQAITDPNSEGECPATHIKLGANKCVHRTAELPETQDVCKALGGTQVGGSDPECNKFALNLNHGECVKHGGTVSDTTHKCEGFNPAPAGTLTGRCYNAAHGNPSECTGAAGSLGTSGTFSQIRACNLDNKVAGWRSVRISCAGTACGANEVAIGGRCQQSGTAPCDIDGQKRDPQTLECNCPSDRPHLHLDGQRCVAQCGVGETLDADDEQCVVCPVGTYKAGAGNTDCEPCFAAPEGATANCTGPTLGARSGGLVIRCDDQNKAVECVSNDECGPAELDAPERKDLALCGPNARCKEHDPRDPGGLQYACECFDGFSSAGEGTQTLLNCVPSGTRTVSVTVAVGGTVQAAAHNLVGGGPAREIDYGTTVTFTAVPAAGFMVSVWTGGAAHCGSAAECAVTVVAAVTVGADFTDVDECAATSPAACGGRAMCMNMDAAEDGGLFTCDCGHVHGEAAYSGSARDCVIPDRRVSVVAKAGGTVRASAHDLVGGGSERAVA